MIGHFSSNKRPNFNSEPLSHPHPYTFWMVKAGLLDSLGSRSGEDDVANQPGASRPLFYPVGVIVPFKLIIPAVVTGEAVPLTSDCFVQALTVMRAKHLAPHRRLLGPRVMWFGSEFSLHPTGPEESGSCCRSCLNSTAGRIDPGSLLRR
jgi:hypothetical protein